jgi:hypothetical protein
MSWRDQERSEQTFCKLNKELRVRLVEVDESQGRRG